MVQPQRPWGVARMGGQGRPSRGLAGTGRVSLAVEAAFDAAHRGPSRSGEPGHDDARGRQPEVSGSRPSTNRRVPPWPSVVATTVRLWLRRRKGALGGLFRRRWAIALAVLAVASLVGGLAVSFPGHSGTASATRQRAAHTGIFAGPPGQSSGAAAVGHAAAVWVAREVSRNAMVACDPGMCRVLRAQGFPAGNLFVMGAGAAGLPFSDVIVATQAVRNLVGSRLQREDAPAVIASFGSGDARIEVRVVAPGGAVAYRAALAADWAARRTAGAELVKSRRIHAGGGARLALLTGKVDSRVLITLAALAVSYPVKVVAFGDSAPGASAGVPIREMEIAGTGRPAYRLAELRRIRSFVLAQRSVFLPSRVSLVRPAAGSPKLRIVFSAPSPLGLLLGRPGTQ